MADAGAGITTSATPILDRLVPLPPPEGVRSRLATDALVGLAVALVLALPLAYPPLRHALVEWLSVNLAPLRDGRLPIPWILKTALGIVAAFPLAVAIHESAHLAAGRAAGFALQSIRFGRLQIEPLFRISLYRGSGAGSGGWTGGWVNLFPMKSDKLALRAAAMIFAGPASNLASAAIVLLLPFPKGLFWGMFVLFSLVLGLMNLLPFRSQSVVSDGGRLLMLLRNRAQGERWAALMKLGAEMHRGTLPESFSSEFLALAVAVRDESPDTVMAHALAFSSAFHRHADAEAAQALETCLAYSAFAMPALREALPCNAAVFQARRRNRADLAEQWLAEIPDKTQLPTLRPSAQAAILEARGDFAGALNRLTETERAAATLAHSVQRDMTLRLLRRWKEEVQRKAPLEV